MHNPDWRNLNLDPGILREPTPDASRLLVWLPGKLEGGFRQWERVGNVPGADVVVKQGLCATAATCMPARQKIQGLFGRFLQSFRKTTGGQSWVLPNGDTVEQAADRQAGLALVWAEDPAASADEARIKECWPQTRSLRKIGPNLFLANGLDLPTPAQAPAGPQQAPAQAQPTQANPGAQAERLLAAARRAGDRGAEVSALTDLGIVYTRTDQAARAIGILEEALRGARQLGDRGRECDVLGNLAVAVLTAGQPERALELLEQNLALARAAGDRFEEKLALERQGNALATLHDPTRARAAFDQAFTLAREAGDRQHQAELLWLIAIQDAETGQRETAILGAQTAIDLFKKTRSPAVGWLVETLRRYRSGELADAAGGLGGIGDLKAESRVGMETWTVGAGSLVASPGPSGEQVPTGPGLMRMAIAATKSLARFLGSGLKTVSAAAHERRLQTCGTCPHHTGVRCKLCGCFTTVKAWLPHEQCPIGKWPS
jgi:tetratricopeptide (TPR) repeat protein